jgi:hypothetical protein
MRAVLPDVFQRDVRADEKTLWSVRRAMFSKDWKIR